MAITKLHIQNLRNIAEAQLTPSHRLNFILGANGSGKSSLLEAIYLLSTGGRSFRANRNQQLIHDGADELLLFCETHYHGRHRIGLRRTLSHGNEVHLDGVPIASSSQLAQQLPVLLISPEHHRLIEDGPPIRRAFLDWGLFHVKPDFFSIWKQYDRCRQQRNTALRTGRAKECRIWHQQMAESGEQIDQYRKELCSLILPQAKTIFSTLTESTIPVSFHYLRGWQRETDLLTTLDHALESDLKAGYTQSGPQRADLQLRIRNQPVERELSRGEQKLLVYALRLSLLTLLNEHGIQTHLLIDDLASELDAHHRTALFSQLLQLQKHQLFITSTEPTLVNSLANAATRDHDGVELFHVKHGHFHT